MAQLLWKSLAVPQNVKHRGTTWPSNSTSRYKLKRNEKLCPQRNLQQMFIEALFTIVEKKQLKCPSMDE